MIVRFFQRWATAVGLVAGFTVKAIALPDDAPWWLELGVVLVVALPIYQLLYKDGVTANRPPKSTRFR